jgi:hypothetical protein
VAVLTSLRFIAELKDVAPQKFSTSYDALTMLLGHLLQRNADGCWSAVKYGCLSRRQKCGSPSYRLKRPRRAKQGGRNHGALFVTARN